MFPKDRNYIQDPFLIKRRVDGKVRTFNISPYSYKPETGYVEMTDVETKELYYGYAKNNQIEVTKKIKVIPPSPSPVIRLPDGCIRCAYSARGIRTSSNSDGGGV